MSNLTCELSPVFTLAPPAERLTLSKGNGRNGKSMILLALALANGAKR